MCQGLQWRLRQAQSASGRHRRRCWSPTRRPAPSIAMAAGIARPPPVYGAAAVPSAANRVTAALPLSAIQALPCASMAMPCGASIAPSEKPVPLNTLWFLSNFTTTPRPLSVTQALPPASMATPTGACRVPPTVSGLAPIGVPLLSSSVTLPSPKLATPHMVLAVDGESRRPVEGRRVARALLYHSARNGQLNDRAQQRVRQPDVAGLIDRNTLRAEYGPSAGVSVGACQWSALTAQFCNAAAAGIGDPGIAVGVDRNPRRRVKSAARELLGECPVGWRRSQSRLERHVRSDQRENRAGGFPRARAPIAEWRQLFPVAAVPLAGFVAANNVSHAPLPLELMHVAHGIGERIESRYRHRRSRDHSGARRNSIAVIDQTLHGSECILQRRLVCCSYVCKVRHERSKRIDRRHCRHFVHRDECRRRDATARTESSISASAGFVVPALSPGLPPVATRYSRGSLPYTAVLLQFHRPEMLKSPCGAGENCLRNQRRRRRLVAGVANRVKLDRRPGNRLLSAMHVARDVCCHTARWGRSSARRKAPTPQPLSRVISAAAVKGCRTTLVDASHNFHGVTVKLRTIELAGSKVELPGCEAVTRTVPAPVNISLFFEIVAGPVTS